METSDVVVIHRACVGDYETVVELSRGIYDGRDYLPNLYHTYLDDPNRMCFVCKCNNHVAGFIMSYVVDGGQTLVEQAARIHPSYRKRGLYHMMQEHSRRETFSKNPNLKRIAWTTGSTECLKRKTTANEPQPVIQCEMVGVLAETRVDHILTIKGSCEDHAKKLNIEVCDTFKKKEALFLEYLENHSVFHEGRVIVAFEPYRLMKENVSFISESPGNALRSSRSDVCGAVTMAISLGTFHHVTSGLRYTINYYSADTRDLDGHFQQHICCLQKLLVDRTAHEKVSVYLFLHGHQNEDKLGCVMKKLSTAEEAMLPMKIVLFEMPFNVQV